jgi:heme-degrading monooxygenase HmoA
MVAAVTATIPPEREGEFLAAFRELSSADKPEGLERSELLRAADGRWVIQSLWRDREAMAAARQSGRKPAVLALLDRLGAAHTHELFTVEHTG